MSTTHSLPPARPRIPMPLRAVQALMLLPLGLLQLGAASYFTVTSPGMDAGDLAVAGWAVAMSASCIVVAARLGHDHRAGRLALGLLTAQLAFAAVKLVAYGESAAIVFGACAAVAMLLLGLPASRRSATVAATTSC